MTPEVLETLEFPEALARVAAHAAGPPGAARIAARQPATDAATIRAALAQVAELAALLITDDSIRAEPVPDITVSLELLDVPGSALEGPALAELTVALAAMRVTAADLKRIGTTHDARRTASLRVDPPPRELETTLVRSIAPDGAVLDSAWRDLARARQQVRESRKRVMDRLGAILGALDQTERAPDAAVTVRGGRYVIPIRSTARARVGGIVHDESATRSTVFVEPPEIIELGNELRAAEAAEQREVLRVLRELTDMLRPQRDTIAAAWEMCIAFDDLCSRARYAVEVNGFVPEVGGQLKIKSGRHPLLSFAVPFDLELAPDEFTILVSGPNTGGKTVLIKAVGLLSLLAQSGIIPPIGPHSSLPVFTEVFADIGDRQSIAASLSTFSAHVAARTLDRLLASVEARGRDIDARSAVLDTRAAQLELERQNLANLEALEAELHAREKALDKDARDRARAYLLEARKTVEAALAQARAAVTEATAKEARRMVEEAIEKTGGSAVGRSGGLTDLTIGDRVKTAQGKVGVVKEIRSDGRVVVEVGAIRLIIAPNLLERVDPTAQPPNRPTAS